MSESKEVKKLLEASYNKILLDDKTSAAARMEVSLKRKRADLEAGVV
jgi:hypothetical protein